MDNNNKETRKNKIYALMKDKTYVPMKEKELVVIMQVNTCDRDVFKECLNELIIEGKIIMNKRGKYSIAETAVLTGIYSASGHGYGFVTVEGYDDDFFISEKDTGFAMHGDTVRIEPLSDKGADKRRTVRHSDKSGIGGRRCEAVVTEVLKRANDIVVGTYDAAKNHYGFVIPDNNRIDKDIFIPLENSMGAVTGSKVAAKILDYGSASKSPEGKIIEILGHTGDPGVDVLAILKSFGIESDFPEKVINQAAKIGPELIETDYNGREDLRELDMVTIDGEDSKDLDDAVSLTMDDDCYILGVHIADVTHYVKEGSAIDKEALARGTSCYPVDRVVPMLPQTLCNGICSLNEQSDRLALSCFMRIDSKGDVKDHRFSMSVIRTNHRMTYTEVNKIITEDDEALTDKYSDVAGMLKDMQKLALILRSKRKSRGSIDFDLPESKIELDEKGHPLSIKPYDRNEATKLIEDFMLIANETVAEHFFWAQVPFVYRIHEKPDIDKIRKLSAFISNFGYGIRIKDETVHPMKLQKLLLDVADSPEETLISRLTLRSMQRAKYSVSCDGHYGLALKYYCHFTSPIRRYPDLQIHRIIKEYLRGNLNGRRIEHYESILPGVCLQSSNRERTAADAEREVEKLKKSEYMSEHIGEIYDGIISGVTNWGIYVELPNTVEGLVHVSSIKGDYYIYDENSYSLIGEATRHRYSLGDKIRVCVNSVDIQMRAIDFIIAD